MKAKDLDRVRKTIDQEGFEYTFVGYSHFDDIKDEEFHRLRKAYIAAQMALADYLGLED